MISSNPISEKVSNPLSVQKVKEVAPGKPSVTSRGIALSFVMYLLYTIFSAAVLAFAEELPYAIAFLSMAIHSAIAVLLLIPAWFLIVRQMYTARRWQQLLAHAITAPVFSWTWVHLYIGLLILLMGGDNYTIEQLNNNKPWMLLNNLVAYIMVFSVIHIIQSQKQLRAREQQTATLQELSRRQEIAALKAQLNPHFLFNTLNSINAMVTRNPEKTRTMITKLSDMLRYSIDSSERASVALREELNFTQTYLELEKERYGERLQFEMEVEPQLHNIEIPPMTIQPLVENALKHGIAKREEEGEILMKVSKSQGQIYVEVHDTGPGFGSESKEELMKQGIGLRNVDRMLREKFGEAAGLVLGKSHENGFSAEVSFKLSIE